MCRRRRAELCGCRCNAQASGAWRRAACDDGGSHIGQQLLGATEPACHCYQLLPALGGALLGPKRVSWIRLGRKQSRDGGEREEDGVGNEVQVYEEATGGQEEPTWTRCAAMGTGGDVVVKTKGGRKKTTKKREGDEQEMRGKRTLLGSRIIAASHRPPARAANPCMENPEARARYISSSHEHEGDRRGACILTRGNGCARVSCGLRGRRWVSETCEKCSVAGEDVERESWMDKTAARTRGESMCVEPTKKKYQRGRGKNKREGDGQRSYQEENAGGTRRSTRRSKAQERHAEGGGGKAGL
ncbi:hypothetical protein B0H19DRAFT_1082335 [Mycena capillaripes]|nr:hypothetical protein B0H19DRAFT_1082335 [Mycena capillaripes]